MSGSPFFLIKNGQNAGEITLQQAAQATAVYSRAWKRGLGTAEVYSFHPDQVKKELGLPKGSFMIYGKRNYFSPRLELAIGLVGEEIIGGPLAAIQAKTKEYLLIVPGQEKSSALAKKIKAKLKGGDLDEIIRFLPVGGCDLKK